METSTQQPYTDTPSPNSSPSSTSTIKPLPALPPTAEEPYRDEPDTSNLHTTHRHLQNLSLTIQQEHQQIHIPAAYRPYTDLPSPSEVSSPTHENDDDVPLAQLLLSPQWQRAPAYQQQSHPHLQLQTHTPLYPLDAPPSYSYAIRQSRTSTLIHWIPSRPSSDPLLIDIEAEGAEGEGEEEVRHAVEKVVAMFIVATLLLVISGVLGWLALGSGLWD